MVEREVAIADPKGLHARPAARFVAAAKEYESAIRVTLGERVVNGKSILGLMILAAEGGVSVRVCADGPDEADALERLCALLEHTQESEPCR